MDIGQTEAVYEKFDGYLKGEDEAMVKGLLNKELLQEVKDYTYDLLQQGFAQKQILQKTKEKYKTHIESKKISNAQIIVCYKDSKICFDKLGEIFPEKEKSCNDVQREEVSCNEKESIKSDSEVKIGDAGMTIKHDKYIIKPTRFDVIGKFNTYHLEDGAISWEDNMFNSVEFIENGYNEEIELTNKKIEELKYQLDTLEGEKAEVLEVFKLI